jgi:thioredoxin 1
MRSLFCRAGRDGPSGGVQQRYSHRSPIGVDARSATPHDGPMSTTTNSSVLHVTEDSFTAEVLESDVPVLVDFWAAWCPPCRAMHPILDQLAGERDDLRIVSIDVEANQSLAARYGVLSMPTFLVFRGGEQVLQLVGSRPRRRLEEELASVL